MSGLDRLSEGQRDRIEDLAASYPATNFDVLEVREDGMAVMEFDDLAGAGTFLINANGELKSSFILRAAPNPYAA